MRKLVSNLFITLDGVVESPHAWNPPYYEQQMTDAMRAQLAAADTHLYGRRSYEMFRAVFTGPASGKIPHAPLMNEASKVLVSRDAAGADWGPTSVISDDVAAAIERLKQASGGEIAVQASATLVRFLLRERLLDELHLLIHPVTVGDGARLLDGSVPPMDFEVIAAERFDSGVLSLRLAPPTSPEMPDGAREQTASDATAH